MIPVTIKDMLSAGVHFGHQTSKWNSAMKSFVYGQKGKIHIIDLEKSYEQAIKASEFMKSVARRGGKVLFVGTKKQAQEIIKDSAQNCGQFYVTKRWLGGTLTNFSTVRARVDLLKKIDQMKEKGILNHYTKKQRSTLLKKYDKILLFLEGILTMNKMPDALFIVDIHHEKIAVKEAKKLGIPVIGIADTNSDPSEVDHPIPGNDDAVKSIRLFCDLMSNSYNEGFKEYEQYLAENHDKQEDVAAVAANTSPHQAKRPNVVKTTKSNRIVVAAGTAEDVEIVMELEKKEKAEEKSKQKESESKQDSDSDSKKD